MMYLCACATQECGVCQVCVCVSGVCQVCVRCVMCSRHESGVSGVCLHKCCTYELSIVSAAGIMVSIVCAASIMVEAEPLLQATC